MGLVERLLPVLAQGGVWIFSLLAVAALLGVGFLGRGRRFLVPARWPGRMLAGFLLVVALLSGLLLYVVRGPLSPELPDIDRLQKAYGAHGLEVVTISNDESAHLQDFAAKYPTSTLNVYASDLDWMDVDGRPLTFIIDRDGVVRACFIGSRSYAAFEREVKKWLA